MGDLALFTVLQDFRHWEESGMTEVRQPANMIELDVSRCMKVVRLSAPATMSASVLCFML